MQRALSQLGVAAMAAAAAYIVYRRVTAKAPPPKGQLRVVVKSDKMAIGAAAAQHVAEKVNAVIAAKGYARVIFATGASQFEFIEALLKLDVQWDKVTCFHLDEYVGLPDDHGASFRKYLRERLFDKMKPQPKKVNYLHEREMIQYAGWLADDEIDLACIGIGENGHIAFNDPPPAGGADFDDPFLVKKVPLDEACRKQQLGEGWFKTLGEVPTHAITLTVPAMMRAKSISCVVPDERKAVAVQMALKSEISTACPATILRNHPDCVLWLDEKSASLLAVPLKK